MVLTLTGVSGRVGTRGRAVSIVKQSVVALPSILGLSSSCLLATIQELTSRHDNIITYLYNGLVSHTLLSHFKLSWMIIMNHPVMRQIIISYGDDDKTKPFVQGAKSYLSVLPEASRAMSL